MDLLISPGGSKTGRSGAADGKDLIKEGSTASFRADVIEASMKAVVLVDFWAPWCGPCKQLGPALEKVVREAKGAARLVKINVDTNQQLAAQLRVQTVPMVYAFKDGRPVDAFSGAVPESELRAFLKPLLGPVAPDIDDIVAEARTLLTDGDAATAAALFQQALQVEPEHPAALAGLLRCLIAVGESAQAETIIAGLPPELARHSDIAAVATALELARRAADIGEAGLLRQRVEANPDDHQARFDLALACFADNQPEAAIDALLELFRCDRTWNDGAARAELIKLFEALGSGHPAVSAGRRRLSSLMFS